MFWACLRVYAGYNTSIYTCIYIYLFTQRVYLDVLRQCSLFDIHTREAEAKILGFISSTLNFL